MEGGIDEAGRGPVVGPLIVAGVAGDPSHLAALGVKDSKRLGPAQRRRLARLLLDDSDIQVEVERIEAATLDVEMAEQTLNEVVMQRFIAIAKRLKAPRLVVDAADVDASRFGRRIQGPLAPGVEVVSEHKADDNHATVAAASIIAKVERDDAIAELARRLERQLGMELGSGYPSDEKTIRFLTAWLARHGELPEGTRHAWKTSQRLLEDHRRRPTRLQDFV